jgi:hypothetical protein
MQFQSRLGEARTQNASITLESIQLQAEYQDYIASHYKAMRDQAEKLPPLRAVYMASLNTNSQQVMEFCLMLSNDKANVCYAETTNVLYHDSSQIDSLITKFRPESWDVTHEQLIRSLAADLRRLAAAGNITEAEQKYFSAEQVVRTECQTLSKYVSSQVLDVSLLGVSPELRLTVSMECFSYGGYGASAAGPVPSPAPQTEQGSRVQVQGSPLPQATPQLAQIPQQNPPALALSPGAPPAALNVGSEPSQGDTRGVNRALLSELVFYYKFYDWITKEFGAAGREFILAPPEFIVIALVISTGILGSFLFHTYTMFLATRVSQFPNLFAILLRASLSVMCALVIFILSRTGFVAITEAGTRTGAAAISPFIIAFISIASGLLAERAMERIQTIGLTALDAPKKAKTMDSGGPHRSAKGKHSKKK